MSDVTPEMLNSLEAVAEDEDGFASVGIRASTLLALVRRIRELEAEAEDLHAELVDALSDERLNYR